MAIDLGSAAATLNLDVSNFVTNAEKASQAMQGIQNASNSLSGDGGFLNWVNQNEASLTKWGKGMLAVGGIITGAFAAPIIAGSRAAWAQVDAVEQATVAMRAYADSSEQVDQVLAGLLDYARSDMGVLFSRQELFSAAQSMLMYGASINDVNGYTQILSRSVGLGLSDWNSLNTVIGRVGSTGRLTGQDFDYLRAAGFDLDDSLRNTNITWEELFANLDKGIPADALAGQADTIRGKSIRLQSALRGLGLAFLGVDSETSKFIEGGLGWQMMRGMENLTALMKRAAPAVQQLGSIFASIMRPIGSLIDLMLRLPQPVQTAMLMFTALSGVALTAGGSFLLLLPRIAATADALKLLTNSTTVIGGLSKAFGALRVAMLGVFANPVFLAGAAIIGAGILAYKTNFLGFGDAVRSALGWVQDLWSALQIVFGNPITNTATLEVGALLDVPYSEWVEMPDGTYKHAELGITATGSGLGTVSWISDPNSPDGKAWTLTVDTDGDGKEEALKVIDSKDHMDGTYTLTAEYVDPNGEVKTFTTWYDKNSGKTIVLDMDAAQAIRESSEVEKLAGRINSMVREIRAAWVLVSLAVQEVIDGLETAIGLAGKLWDAITFGGSEGDPSKTGEDYYGEGANQYPATYGQGQAAPPPIRTKRNTQSQTSTSPMDFKNLTAGGPAFGLGQAFRDVTKSALEAGAAVGVFDKSVYTANPNIMATASTTNGFGGTMNSTAGTTAAAGASIGNTFGSIASSALSNFTAMNSNASSQATAMNSAVAGQFLGMKTQAAVQLALMASSASTQGAAVNTNLTKGVTAATNSATNVLARLAGIVSGAGASAAVQALFAGSNIGHSFAAGMESALGRIRSAANAMVGAAMTAVTAKAMIASPSKVFTKYGEWVGVGFERGILSKVADVQRAGQMLVPTPALNYAVAPAAYGGGTTVIDKSTHTIEYRYFSESDLKTMMDTAESAPERAIELISRARSVAVGGR